MTNPGAAWMDDGKDQEEEEVDQGRRDLDLLHLIAAMAEAGEMEDVATVSATTLADLQISVATAEAGEEDANSEILED